MNDLFLWLINSLHFSRFVFPGVRMRMSGGQWRMCLPFSGYPADTSLK